MKTFDFSIGWQLFCESKFWDAHEEWEKIWRQTNGNEKLFFQVWIQTAALGLKLQSPHQEAAGRLRARILELSAELPPDLWSLSQMGKSQFMDLLLRWAGDPAEFLLLQNSEIPEEIP